MTDKDTTDQELDAFFSAAKDTAPDPSPGLMARVLTDAQAVQGQTARVTAGARHARRPRSRQLIELLGGWPAMAGLVAAGLAGVWLGFNPPSALSGLLVAGFDAVDPALGGMTQGVELELLALEEG
jgi:hypothetical protein